VKRGDLIRHLQANGCSLEREGSKHTVYVNEAHDRRTTVPRHAEIHDFMARKICRDLGIGYPGAMSR
jgi:predicted RNA binding protein YcfA (HicA-like mRNA interferase family)